MLSEGGTPVESLYNLIHCHTAALYGVLYSSPWFFIDYWSFVHFGSGLSLMVAARALRMRRVWGMVLALLVAYEVLELAFIYLAIRVFLPESIPDQVTDIVVGLLGCALASLPWNRTRETFRDAVAAVTIALVWVWGYGYAYNIPSLNSPHVNWWALLLWSGGLFGVLRLFRRLKNTGKGDLAAVATVWAVSLAALLFLEYLGYQVLGIQETGGHPPLIFNLIHGTAVLKVWYLFSAPLTILAVRGGSLLFPRLTPRRPARDALPQVGESADTVSEVREVKPAFSEGIEPQPGIDF